METTLPDSSASVHDGQTHGKKIWQNSQNINYVHGCFHKSETLFNLSTASLLLPSFKGHPIIFQNRKTIHSLFALPSSYYSPRKLGPAIRQTGVYNFKINRKRKKERKVVKAGAQLSILMEEITFESRNSFQFNLELFYCFSTYQHLQE